MSSRVAVVGVGGWGKNHARVLSELGVLAAICDINPERIVKYSGMYGVPGYTSVDRMLERERIDAAVVATPTSTHVQVALRLIEEGKHVLVEKPLAPTSDESRLIVEKAKDVGAILASGYIERFNPAVRELRDIMEKGRLGSPLFAEFHRESRRPAHIVDVGILHDTVVHDIDTARWLLGEPNKVYARLGRIAGPHEDYATLIMEFDEPRTAVLTANWITPKKERRMILVFSGGIATVNFVEATLRIDDEGGGWEPSIERKEPLKAELENFIDAVHGGAKPLITGEDALRTTLVAEAAEESARLSKPMEVPRS